MDAQRLRLTDDGQQLAAALYPADPRSAVGAVYVFAHGAGAPHTSGFITRYARGLAARGVDVLTFNFPYMEARRRAPDRGPLLERALARAVREARGQAPHSRLFAGGKSMGGRIATQLAAGDDPAAREISGLVVLGYPLHPPGRPDQLRVAHLPRLRVPLLVVQGERDPFGTPAELSRHLQPLGAAAQVHAVAGGDHSLAPPRGSTSSQDQVDTSVLDFIAAWVRMLMPAGGAS